MSDPELFMIESPGPTWPQLTRSQILAAYHAGRLPSIAVVKHGVDSECVPVLTFLSDELNQHGISIPERKDCDRSLTRVVNGIGSTEAR